MKITASELAVIVSGKLFGNENVVLTGVNGLSVAKESEVSFLGNLKYLSEALKSKAGIIFIADDMDISQFKNKNIIKVPDPRYAYSIVFSIFLKGSVRSRCIQFLYAGNFCSLGWHDLLFIVMSVVVGFLYISISICPCLFNLSQSQQPSWY